MARAARNAHLALIILGCFGGGSLYGWSGYLPAVRASLGVGNAAASMVFSLALVSFTLGVLLGPALFGRVPERVRLPLIAGLAVAALSLSGASTGLTGFALAYGAGFGFASGALYNHAVSHASATASATVFVPVSVAAFGLGGAVFGPVHLWLGAAGWGLWSVLPALVCLAAVGVLAMICPPAGDSAPARAIGAHGQAGPHRRADLGHLCCGVLFGPDRVGLCRADRPAGRRARGACDLSRSTWQHAGAAVLGGQRGPFRPGARHRGGVDPVDGCAGRADPGDRAGTRRRALVPRGLAYGQLAATTPLLVRSQVSPTVFAGSFGWVFTGWGVAGLAGPWTAGWLLDATGTLRPALIACITLAGLSLVLVLRFAASDRQAKSC
jgi:OFA family oxalate/formate antiporter-like MFS transporter